MYAKLEVTEVYCMYRHHCLEASMQISGVMENAGPNTCFGKNGGPNTWSGSITHPWDNPGSL